MESVIFLFLRRIRKPLLAVIVVYSISITGLMLIPGVDENGNVWHFDFFHAFYFVSYMGSTIGFGELPHPFTPVQRMWVTFSLYVTVIVWLYSIGKILALIQDPAFRKAVTEARFIFGVRNIREPFYLVCGYGETGSLLVRALIRRGFRCVVIERNQDNLNGLELEDLNFDVPHLCADASETHHLVEAGIKQRHCHGIVAITDSDEINVKIAITSKLLNPSLRVVSRARMEEPALNMASFDTDYIIRPFQAFADHLAMSLRSPNVQMLQSWLTTLPGRPLPPKIAPPKGHWILAGYGGFGKAILAQMEVLGIPVSVIEAREERAPQGAVIGRATEADPLLEAGVNDAVGLIAGTASDANNLSIIMTARALNPSLYMVGRMDRRRDTALFQAANVDLIVESSRIIAWNALPILTVPLLSRFLQLARAQNDEWAEDVISEMRAMSCEVTPETWSFEITPKDAPAIVAGIRRGRTIRLHDLCTDPGDRDQTLPVLYLLLLRVGGEILIPDLFAPLEVGDRILLCSQPGFKYRMRWVLYNDSSLEYVVSGETHPDSSLLRWLARRRPTKTEQTE